MTVTTDELLDAACAAAGVDATGAQLIRAAENHLYRLRGNVVARLSRSGQIEAARKEVRVSRWLASVGIPVVEALPDIEQPFEMDGRAVTFWRELPPHHEGSLADLAILLRQLHTLPAPDFELPALSPFVRLRERLDEASSLSNKDRDWLLERLAAFEHRYGDLPPGQRWCAVHGDAWTGNVASTKNGAILLDLERFSFGPPEWDLAAIAVDYTTFGSIALAEWQHFCSLYGYDVMAWDGFELLRDIRELRKVTFAWQLAGEREDIALQASFRLACLRGEHGSRPWGWSAVP